ncbi:MAG: alpha-amylase, partial [Chloroflexota bacterium]
SQFRHLLDLRSRYAAFHPLGRQKVLDLGSAVFALERTAPDGSERIIALHNVTGNRVLLTLPKGQWRDILNENESAAGVTLAPYQVAWLRQL